MLAVNFKRCAHINKQEKTAKLVPKLGSKSRIHHRLRHAQDESGKPRSAGSRKWERLAVPTPERSRGGSGANSLLNALALLLQKLQAESLETSDAPEDVPTMSKKQKC